MKHICATIAFESILHKNEVVCDINLRVLCIHLLIYLFIYILLGTWVLLTIILLRNILEVMFNTTNEEEPIVRQF